MPLLGSSRKHDNSNINNHHGASDLDNDVFGAGAGQIHSTNQAALNDYPSSAPGAGMGNVGTYGGQPQQAGVPSTMYNNNDNLASAGHHGAGHTLGNNQNDQYARGGGVGSGHQGGGRGIPPTGALNNNNSNTNSSSTGTHGSGGRIAGKIESAIGSVVGSDALKAKGLQKEHEANAIKLQGRELSEAERLEREALMRRERAVAHGADPANSTLGVGNPGVGSGHGGQF